MSNQSNKYNAIEYINNSINVEDIELNEDDSCPICLENIDNGVVKYQCTHKYCSDCIKHWHNLCPLCRAYKKVIIDNNTSNIIIPTGSRLSHLTQQNIDGHLGIQRRVPEQHQNIYKSKWERQICHTMNHELVYLNPYGVTVICRDCKLIQCFNLMH
tara:strand:+ start:477 stop:947 length:471 start_codon:yes stop_codon:yes gene_type:complete